MAGSYSVSTVFRGVDRLSPTFKNMGRSAAGFGTILKGILGADVIRSGFRFLTNQARSFVTEASRIEDATAAFTPLLGNVERATELVNRLNKEAATTPFQFQGISNVAKQLLPVMNGNIEQTAETFRMLGDTAGGNIQKLESITRGYTKALLKGKPDMEALNMISEAGVPIFTEMAKSMGVTQNQLFELSRQGKLTNDDLTNAFKTMTREGGIFFGGMEIASQTLTGRFSTLKDNISLTKAAIGQQLMPVLKPLVDQLITAAQHMRTWVEANGAAFASDIISGFKTAFKLINSFIPLIAAVVSGMVAWKVATIALMVAQKAQIAILAFSKFLQFVRIIAMITKAKGAWAAAQWAINFAMTANPIGLIIVGIAALVGAIVVLVRNWDKVKAAVMRVWNWFSKLLDNPLIAAAGLIFAPFLTIPALIIKHWQPIMDFFKMLIQGVGQGIKKIGEFFSRGNARSQTPPQNQRRSAPNAREAEARQRVQFDGRIELSGAPANTSFTGRTRGAAPIRTETLGSNR